MGPATHLTDLFVNPPLHGRGIGRSLLDVVMAGAGERTTFSSADPRALPIYVRAGMRPWWPAFYLRGDASQLPAGGLDVARSPVAESVARELGWSGVDRLADARYWTAEPGGSALASSIVTPSWRAGRISWTPSGFSPIRRSCSGAEPRRPRPSRGPFVPAVSGGGALPRAGFPTETRPCGRAREA